MLMYHKVASSLLLLLLFVCQSHPGYHYDEEKRLAFQAAIKHQQGQPSPAVAAVRIRETDKQPATG